MEDFLLSRKITWLVDISYHCHRPAQNRQDGHRNKMTTVQRQSLHMGPVAWTPPYQGQTSCHCLSVSKWSATETNPVLLIWRYSSKSTPSHLFLNGLSSDPPIPDALTIHIHGDRYLFWQWVFFSWWQNFSQHNSPGADRMHRHGPADPTHSEELGVDP